MKFQILAIALLLVAVQSQSWLLYERAFQDNSLQPSDLEGWSFQNNQNGNELTYCGDITLVGGYQAAGKGAVLSKKFAGLPAHYKVKIVATVFFIDSWDSEFFLINVNGREVFREQSQVNWHTQMCGTSQWGERVAALEVEVAHFESDIEVSFSSTLNENADNESWGIRDFQLHIMKCEGPCKQVASEFSGDFTTDDVQGWRANKEVAEGYVSECEGHKLVGGYKKFGQKFQFSKTFEKLPKHYRAVIAFKLWQIDSWDGNEQFRAIIDGKSAYAQLKSMGAHGGEFQCGNGSFKDQMVDVTIEVPHSGKSLTVLFEDSLNENTDNESWGISDFRIYTIACEGNCSTVVSELQTESFNADAVSGWQLNGKDYNRVTSCTRVSMVGGYNELAGGTLSKTFSDLPPHTHIMVAIEVWFIDSWDNENFSVAVDQVSGLTTTKSKGEWQVQLGNVCGGNNWTEEVQLIWVELPHFGSSATLSLISELNQAANDESWGFRELNIYVRNDQASESSKEVSKSLVEPEFKEIEKEWDIQSPVAKSVQSDCGGKQIMGGFNTFSGKSKVTREWTDLPEHDYAIFYFKIYFIDSWDNESFLAQVDGLQRQQITKLTYNYVSNQNICGAGQWADNIYFAELKFQHNAKNIKLELFTMLDQAASDESWGIRDFHFFVGKDEHYRPDCPTLYTECGYEGQEFNLCENINDFDKVEWSQQVKSVWVPKGWEATLYEEADFQGKKHVFTAPVECLEDGPVYQFIRVTAPKITNLKVQNNFKSKHNIKNHLKKNLRK